MKMKKVFTRICIAVMAVACMTSSVFALRVIPIDNDKVFSEEIRKQESVSSWAEAEVDAAIRAGLVPELTGNPAYSDAITREQFAELVTTFASKYSTVNSTGTAFDDCDNSSVLWAAASGIVTGVGNNKFDPKKTTNREQIATMLYRAINHIKEEGQTKVNPLTKAGSIAVYTDKGRVSSWAAESVGALAANGIMKGTSDTTLSPKSPCTVEQSILLIYRIYKTYEES